MTFTESFLKSAEMSVQEYLREIKALVSHDEANLNQIFDRVNLLSAAEIQSQTQVVEDLLLNLAKLIPTNNDHLLAKFCCLLCYLIENSLDSLSSSPSAYLVDFMILKLSSCGTWVLNDVLLAFSTLLCKAPTLKIEQVNILLKEDSILFTLLTLNKDDKIIQYHVLQFFSAVLKNLSEATLTSEKINLCYLSCLSVLKESFIGDNKLNAKILICSLKCLQLIFCHKNAVITNTGEILGLLKSLSFYGFPGQTSFSTFDLVPTLSVPETSVLQESLSESDVATHPKLRKQKKNRRRVKKNPQRSSQADPVPPNEVAASADNDSFSTPVINKPFKDMKIISSSSDSEFSDVDSQASRTRDLFASVRQNAYQTLQVIVRLIDQKTMFSYWTAFLPDHPSVPSNRTLFSTILKDSASQVRLSALCLLAEMLRGSKQYLILADGRNTKRHSAFTSLSSILASMMSETHRCLLLALLTEKSTLLILQILKCYAILAENVPYNKLNNQILFKYLKHVKGFFHHKDIQVQVASLTVFTCVLNSNQTPDELETVVLSPDFDIALPSTALDDVPWIVEVCRQKVHNDDHITVKIQSLQFLSGLTGKYFAKSILFFPVVKEVILFCLNDSESSLQYHGVKLMDVIGRCISDASSVDEKLKQLVSDLFLNAAGGPLIKCLTDDNQKPLQAAVCDCLSTLTADTFASLDSKQQMMYVSILLGLAADSNANVRGSAIRCLGIFSLFPELAQDASFQDDLGRILARVVSDTNFNVRFKASWALANLSDAFFLHRDSNESEVSIQLFLSVGTTCLEYSKDCDRVKANAVRAIGNFLLFLPPHYLGSLQVIDFVKKACETLLVALSANFMKVCWNACYALRSMMKNEPLLQSALIQTESVVKALICVLKSPNFKVRISAAQATSALSHRSQYGSAFPSLWKQLLLTLLSSDKDVNFREIKHRENLSKQLCETLCHLASMLSLEDVSEVEEETLLAREMLITSMRTFRSAENRETLTSALWHVEHLEIEAKKCRSVLVILREVFDQAL